MHWWSVYVKQVPPRRFFAQITRAALNTAKQIHSYCLRNSKCMLCTKLNEFLEEKWWNMCTWWPKPYPMNLINSSGLLLSSYYHLSKVIVLLAVGGQSRARSDWLKQKLPRIFHMAYTSVQTTVFYAVIQGAKLQEEWPLELFCLTFNKTIQPTKAYSVNEAAH